MQSRHSTPTADARTLSSEWLAHRDGTTEVHDGDVE